MSNDLNDQGGGGGRTKTCPVCGAENEPKASQCFSCNYTFGAEETLPSTNGNGMAECPGCGAVVSPGSTSCVVCGAVIGEQVPTEAKPAEEGYVVCPSCGADTPSDSANCAVCGAIIAEGAEAQAAETPKEEEWDMGVVSGKGAPVEEALEETAQEPALEPESAKEEETPPEKPILGQNEFACPSCNKPVAIGSGRCPNCWVDLPEMTRCPHCNVIIPLSSTACPDCFAKLEDGKLVEEPASAEEAPEEVSEEPEEALMPKEETEEVMEEITELYGVQCPFCNAVVNAGEDICPECGMPLVEGEAEKEEEEEKAETYTHPKRDWYKIIAVCLVLILLISAIIPFAVPLPHVDREQVRIDGNFGEWQNILNNTDPLDVANPNINLLNTKAASDAFNIYFYSQVQGEMFGDDIGAVERIFMDVDQDASTGYMIQGIGADYQIRLFGHDGDVESSSCLMFNPIRDRNDFNAFESFCPATPFANGTECEIRLSLEDLGIDRTQRITSVYYMGNTNGEYDISNLPVVNYGSALLVRQSSLVPANGLVSGAAANMLNLDLSVSGDYALVNSITIADCQVTGTTFPVNITSNETLTLTVTRDVRSLGQGSLAHSTATPADFAVSNAQVVVTGTGAYAYATNAPALITIDGAFADWAGKGQRVADTIDDVMAKNEIDAVDNPALDITEYGTETENNNVNFYLDVSGSMFAGFEVPVKEETYHEPATRDTRSDTATTQTPAYDVKQSDVSTRQASPNIRPPTTYKPQKGEDCVLIFLDTDNSSLTGYIVNTLGADRLIEVRGQNGEVTDTFLYSFQGSDQNSENWAEISASSVLGVSDGTRMEASVPITQLNPTGEMSAYFHVIDWDKNGDYSNSRIWDVNELTRRSGTRQPSGPPSNNRVSGFTYDSGGSNPVNSTVIAYYEAYNAYMASTQGVPLPPFILNEGVYWFYTVTPGHRLYLNASSNSNWINNSATTVSQDVNYHLTLNTYSPYVPLNFTVGNYGNGPKVLLDWDCVSQPPGGFTIYRTTAVWYNGTSGWLTPWFPKATSAILTNFYGDYYVDDTVAEGVTYYYFIAATDAGGAEIAYSSCQFQNATSPPQFPYTIRGFTKDPADSLYPFGIPGVTVTVQNFNYTGVLQTHTQVTDALGRYEITLQPWEYRFDNSTAWCNGTFGNLRGYNWTTIPAWWWWGQEIDSESLCNITLWPPNVTVGKSVDFEIASPSQDLIYTIWINNSNSWNSSIVWVNDTLPTGVTYTGDTNASAVGVWADSAVWATWGQIHNWTFTNVTPGNHSFFIYVTIDPNGAIINGTVLVNWVYLNSTCLINTTYFQGNYSFDNATTLILVSNITVNKTVDLAVAYPGDFLTYTIYFNNTGGMNATLMWINDTLPNEVTFIAHTANDAVLSPTAQPFYQSSGIVGQNLWFNFTNVTPGPHNFMINVQINLTVANNTLLTNWVFCNYTTEFGMRPESNASASTLVIRPYINVSKEASTDQALTGDLLTYTIWFNNSGEAAIWVWINDTLPAGVVYVSDDADTSPTSGPYFFSRDTSSNILRYVFTSVPYGDHSFNIVVRIVNSTPYCTWLNNTVTCYYAPNGEETSDYALTHVNRPLIQIVKVANVTAAYPGQTVNFTIFFNNTDTAPATNVWLNDTLDMGLIYVGDSAATNATHTLLSKGNFGLNLWFNFTNVLAGDHYFNITVLLDSNLTEGMILENWVSIVYTQSNGLPPYGPYFAVARVIVIGGPLIEVSKLVNQDIANTGEQLTYWIFFNNTGNGNATFVWINDTLPLGVTYASDTAGSTSTHTLDSKGRSGQNLWFNFSNVMSMPSAHSFLIYVNVTNDTDMTTLTNWVYCNYTTNSGLHAPETNDSATFVLHRPIMTVAKTVDRAVAAPGDILNYTIWYNNTGSYPADVWLNDTIPPSTTYLTSSLGAPYTINGRQYTWHVGIVPAHTNNSAWIEVQVNLTTPSGTYLNNTVELNYTCPASGYQFNGSMAQATTIVSAMVVEKIVDLAFANPGDFLNYTIYFDNTASFTIPFAWINDTLPVGVTYISNTASADLPGIFTGFWMVGQNLYFNFTNVNPNSFNSFQINVQINAGVAPGTWLNNTAHLDYRDNLGNSMPASWAWANTMVNRPIIYLVKIVDQTTAYQGDVISYTIWFNNTGSCNASFVWLNDTLPSWVSVVGGPTSSIPWTTMTIGGTGQYYYFYYTNLPVGSHSITFLVLIDPAIPDNTNITNTAYCVYQMANGIGWNSTDNATTWVVCATILVQKAVDLTIAYPGDYLTYTIWFNNTGHGAAANVWVNDTLPADVIYISSSVPWTENPATLGDNNYSWYFTNVAPGVHSFTITVQINTDVYCGQNLTNYVLCEYYLPNGVGWLSEDWAVTSIIRPNITVVKTVNMVEANPSDYLVYTIYFNNTCQGTADYVNITDELPNWVTFVSHTAGSVVGATFVFPEGMSGRFIWFNFINVSQGDHIFTITVQVNSGTPDCPYLVNNVTCQYGLFNGVAFEPSSDNATTHINRPTITVTKTVDYQVASPGFYLNYTIIVTNENSGTAPNIWVNDTLPPGVAWINDTAWTVFGCAGWWTDGTTWYYNFTNIPGFTTFTFQITVWIDTAYGFMPGDELWNWVWVDYTAGNGAWAGESVDSALTIISTIAVVKEVDFDHAAPGDMLTYSIWFNNTGTTTAAYMWINDTLPNGVTYQSDTANLVVGATFVPPTGVSGLNLWFNFTNVLPGVHFFTIQVQINMATAPGTILDNWVYLNFTNDVGIPLIESWDNAITIVDRANITVAKTVNQSVAFPGDYLNYTINFNNTGQANAAFVWINDTLPAGVVWVNDSAWTVAGYAGWWTDGTTWYYNFTNLPPGNYTFYIIVQILITVPNGTVLTNTVTCDYTTGTYKHERTIDWANTTVICPIITLEKVVDITEATIGEVLTYTIYFNNTGWGDAFVNITDILDPGLIFNLSSGGDFGNHIFTWWASSGQTAWMEFTNVAPGVHYVWFTVNVSTTVQECNWLYNTVFLNYSLSNGVIMTSVPLWDEVSTHIIVPNVTVEKSVDRNVASPGDYLTYTITFTNWNIGTAGSVNLTDVLPNGVVYITDTANTLPEFEPPTGQVGQTLYFNFSNVQTGTYSFNVVVYINPLIANNTVLVNWVYLNYTTTTGINITGNADNATTLITWMAVVKVVSQDIVMAGSTIIYTIYFNNTANFTMLFVWINDTLPSGVTYVSDSAAMPGGLPATFTGSWNDSITWFYNFTNVTPGAHWFTITANVSYINPPGSLISNFVILNYTDELGNPMLGSVDWANSSMASPDLIIFKDVNLSMANPGDILTYTITIWNFGTDATGMIWINDTLPLWLTYLADNTSTLPMPPFVNSWINVNELHFNFTGLGVGASISFTITVLVSASAPDVTLINWAFANYTSPSGYPMQEVYDDAITIVIRPAVTVQKTVDKSEANPGDFLYYTIWYNNTGIGIAGDLWINDTLPIEVQYLSDTSGLPIGPNAHLWIGQFHSWHFTDVAPGSYSFIITTLIDSSIPNCRWFNNSVFWIYTSQNHIIPANVIQQESNNATTHIIAPIITVVKVVDQSSASPGDLLTYTIFFNNTGQDEATWVWINDTLPMGVTRISDTANSVAGVIFISRVYDAGNRTWLYIFASVLPGDHSFDITVLINPAVMDGTLLNNTVTCDYSIENGFRFERTTDWAVTIVNRPIISFGKVADVYYTTLGDFVNYTIYFNNTGSGSAANIWIYDILPNEVSYISENASSIPGATFVIVGQNIWINFTNVVPGFYWFNITVQVNTNITAASTLATNWAYLNYSSSGGTMMIPGLEASADILIIRPIIAVEKEVNLGTAAYNESLIYTIWFNNTGADNAAYVWINDTLPSDVTYINDTAWQLPGFSGSWNDTVVWYFNFTNVAPGNYFFVIVVTVNVGAVSPVINNVTLNYTASNNFQLEESWDEAITVITAMAVVKVSTDYVVTVGQLYNYTIWFNNTGGSNINSVWINDTLPSGVIYVNDSAWSSTGFAGSWNDSVTWFYNFTNLPPGNYSFNITVQVNNVPPNTELWNVVSLNYTDYNDVLQQGSIVWILSIVEGPIIEVSKVVDLDAAYIGDFLTYTIYFNNTGTGNASRVWVNDTLPNGVVYINDNATSISYWIWTSNAGNYWQFEFGDLPPGDYWFWISVRINASDPSIYDGRWLNNTVVCFYNVSIYGWSSQDYALTRVLMPMIDVDKSVNMLIASPYDTLTYIIWFNNTGSTALYVWVNDTLPFGFAGVTYISDTNSSCPGVDTRQYVGIFGNTRVWLFTNVQPGAHFFTITVTVNDTVIDGDILQNFVLCEVQILNGITWNSTAFAETIIRTPQIQIVKRVNKDMAYPNEILRYTIWFNNTGSLYSPMVRIEDIMPIGVTFRSVSGAPPPWQSGNLLRWDFYNVAPGVHSFSFTVTINANTPDWTLLINTVWCNYTIPNGYVINDGTDSAFTTVIRPVIVVNKIVDLVIASPGDYLFYTIFFNNTGHGNASNVWINDTLPQQVIYSPDPIAPPYQFLIGQNIGWRFVNVPPGNHWFTFKVEILSATNGTVLTDWAYCNYTCPVANQPDLKLEESWDRADTIVGLPQINIVKVANVQTVNPGDSITYTIYYNNTGIVGAIGVTITDILPPWVTYVSDTSGIIPSVFGTDTYTWNIGVVPPLTQNSFTVTVSVSTDNGAPDNELLINEAICTYYIQNGQSWQSRDTAEVLLVKPIIELTKSVNRYYASPYDILVYYIEFSNLGSDNASFLWINETLPAGVTFINHTANNVTGATYVSSGIVGLAMWFNFTDVMPGIHYFTIVVRIDATTPDGRILTNLAICEYKARNGLSYTPVSDYALTIVMRPIITIEKLVNQTTALPGEYLLYTIYFNNTGSGTAAYVWINDTLPIGVVFINHSAITTGTHIFMGMGMSGQYLWFNFTDVRPGSHFFNITVLIDQNITISSLVNNATCEYMAANGFSFESSYDDAITIVTVALGPPLITTTPPPFVYAGTTFNLTAYVTDDMGIVQVIIYYIDIEGILWSANMSAIQVDANGRGWYYFTVPSQSWKGVVSYYVWAIDTSGLTNKTGWYDVDVVLPPYFVWGNVMPSEDQVVARAIVIVINNQTQDSVMTIANDQGRYQVDLAQWSSGYVDAQDIIVFAIDAELGWYGYAYSTIDILRYVSDPQLPQGITDSLGHPYHRIDVYLNEISEFMTMAPVVFIIVITLLIINKKKMNNRRESHEVKEE
jgi:uncharacterized repeat protein (TIGR01451 family)